MINLTLIRLAEYEELQSICSLMKSVFKNKMQDYYTDEGIASFGVLVSLKSLQKRFLNNNLFYIYIKDEDIKGVIELESPCHIAFLFSALEKKGIAKDLCNFALKNNKEDICTVGAFSQSIAFYKKLGFIEVAEEKSLNGMTFTLMAKVKLPQ